MTVLAHFSTQVTNGNNNDALAAAAAAAQLLTNGNHEIDSFYTHLTRVQSSRLNDQRVDNTNASSATNDIINNEEGECVLKFFVVQNGGDFAAGVMLE